MCRRMIFKIITVKTLFAISVIVIILTLFVTYLAKDEKELNLTSAVKKVIDNTEERVFVQKEPQKNKTSKRPFVFLTQTEQCLRRQTVENLELSSSKTCRCDVIVVSFKNQCREETPPHVTYLFDNTTTWRTGRNKLFFHASDRKPAYIYYIFMDDDVFLKFNKAATSEMKQHSPIQVFQNWLLDYEPAVGVVDFQSANEGKNVRNRMRTICGADLDKTSLTNPTVMYDMLFNAFHGNAVRHVFPLVTRRETVSWWMTGKYVHSVVELKFRGQALLFFPVTVVNPLHRDYPKALDGQVDIWREYIETIRKEAPAQYANHSLFTDFKKDPFFYVKTSRTYCMGVNRHQSIAPFAHFAREKL